MKNETSQVSEISLKLEKKVRNYFKEFRVVLLVMITLIGLTACSSEPDTENPEIILKATEYKVERASEINEEEFLKATVKEVSDNQTDVEIDDIKIVGLDAIDFNKIGIYPIKLVLTDKAENEISKNLELHIIQNKEDRIKAKEEAERKAKEEEERKAKEEAERKAKEEAERKAKEEAERKAKEEAERKAKEEAERKAKEEAERKASSAAPASTSTPAPPANVYYQNCTDVRNNGAAPIYPGDPGWQDKFDRDKDGVGCE